MSWKLAIIVVMSILLIGCWQDEEELPEGQHCYLYCAKYLECGNLVMAREWTEEHKIKWSDRGYVDATFNELNTDPDLEIYTDHEPTIEKMQDYLDCGYRLAFMYRTGTNDKHYVILYRIVKSDGEVYGFIRDLTMGTFTSSIRLDELYIFHVNVVGYF